jgi:uncharacterized membrane protein YhaH (DUF805 family)
MAALDPALLPLKRYADFSGRSTRTELLSFLFLIVVVNVAVVLAASVINLTLGRIVAALIGLAVVCPWLAVIIRRFHDQGRSGWWALAPLLLGGGASITPETLGPWTLFQIAAAVAVWTLLLWKPDEGENRYGPDPRTQVI